MRPLLLAAVMAAFLVFAGVSGARTATHWEYIHMHANAYGGSGHCDKDWHAQLGQCNGLLEDGTFLGHRYLNKGIPVHWSWVKGNVNWWMVSKDRFFAFSKPENWHTFTITGGTIGGSGWKTGTTAAAGHQGGPLYVNLSSHSTPFHVGYSLDFHGYVYR